MQRMQHRVVGRRNVGGPVTVSHLSTDIGLADLQTQFIGQVLGQLTHLPVL